jgi:hypothetical protein
MARQNQPSGGAPPPGRGMTPGPRPPGSPQPGARPGLIPAIPLRLSTALLQVLLLLGVPIALLLLARPILRTFFPELGY